jgi:hypothetical protein
MAPTTAAAPQQPQPQPQQQQQQKIYFYELPLHETYNDDFNAQEIIIIIEQVTKCFFKRLEEERILKRNSLLALKVDYKNKTVKIKSFEKNLIKLIELYLIEFNAGQWNFISPFSHIAFSKLNQTQLEALTSVFRLISTTLKRGKRRYSYLRLDVFNELINSISDQINNILNNNNNNNNNSNNNNDNDNDNDNEIPPQYHFLVQTAYSQYLRFVIKGNIQFDYFKNFIDETSIFPGLPKFDINFKDSFSLLSYSLYHFFSASNSQHALQRKKIVMFLLESSHFPPFGIPNRNIYGETLISICKNFANSKNHNGDHDDHKTVCLAIIKLYLKLHKGDDHPSLEEKTTVL